ncbi:DoxX family protein [Paenibacillus albiflavus]|uniref:DoxX family protein n=1 Tax=Paenibacillus albiflavus TaxID=2545760 RepID=A0A4V2WNY1_9BACL|nr:DoxX family protein [Paenibacillus albiflavus]TCZ77242.1 DoxX family protein [Paenibacillus albiflavus]
MLSSIGLLVIRLVVGLTLAAHGAQKLFGWFGGYGPKGTGGFFDSIGFKPGVFLAVLVGLAEFGGGLMVAAGFLTWLGAAFITIVMLGALLKVHAKNGFWVTSNGIEFTLIIIAVVVGIAFIGAGDYSLDALWFK